MNSKWEKVYERELETYRWSPSIVMKDFSTTLKKTHAKNVLDLGCGIGRNAIPLAKEGYFVTGVDISYLALQVAAKKIKVEGIKNIIVLHNDITSLPFPSDHFDAVFSINVIHHARIKEIHQIVKEMRRVLCKNGVGMVTVTSDKDYKYGKGRKIEKNTYELFEGSHGEVGIPHHFFDESEVKSLFKNFKITNMIHLEEMVGGGQNCHWYITFSKPI